MKIVAWVICWALGSMVCQAAGREGVVRLYERVGVAGEAIRLSDFLPTEASAEVRDVASRITFGRSPQLGSTRILLKEQIMRGLQEHPELLEQLSIPEQITAFRQGWPIRREAIQTAISDFVAKQKWGSGPFDFGTFQLQGRPNALISDPALKVESFEQDSLRHELKFAIACVSKPTCGTFLVSAALPSNFTSSALTRPVSGGRASSRVRGEILARAGQPAMLSMQEDNMHIFVRVICLERGSLGQTIRAREANSHRIYHAEVVGAAALRAGL